MTPSSSPTRAARLAGATHRGPAARHARRLARARTCFRSTRNTRSAWRRGRARQGFGRGTSATCTAGQSTSRSTASALAAAKPRAVRMRVPAGPQTIGARSCETRARGVDDLSPSTPAQRRRQTRSRSSGRSRRRARATRRAGARSSSARPRAPRTRPRAPRRSCKTLATARVPPARARRRPGARDAAEFYARTAARRGTFEAGIQHALARVLVDPEFIFRFENEPADVGRGAVYRHQRFRARVAAVVLPVEQHPRRRAARGRGDGRAREPGVLERQVRRMLADPKADALVDNFAGQWLLLRQLDDGRARRTTSSTSNLRQRFRAETEHAVRRACCATSRSVARLLDADYTFVDERLARHYGIAERPRQPFRRACRLARRTARAAGCSATAASSRSPRRRTAPRR